MQFAYGRKPPTPTPRRGASVLAFAAALDPLGSPPSESNDYVSAVKASDLTVALKGDPMPTPWEPALHETMRRTGRAIYEETVADQLMADLTGWLGL